MAQRVELHEKNKRLEPAIKKKKKKDVRPNSIKGFKEEPRLTNG